MATFSLFIYLLDSLAFLQRLAFSAICIYSPKKGLLSVVFDPFLVQVPSYGL